MALPARPWRGVSRPRRRRSQALAELPGSRSRRRSRSRRAPGLWAARVQGLPGPAPERAGSWCGSRPPPAHGPEPVLQDLASSPWAEKAASPGPRCPYGRSRFPAFLVLSHIVEGSQATWQLAILPKKRRNTAGLLPLRGALPWGSLSHRSPKPAAQARAQQPFFDIASCRPRQSHGLWETNCRRLCTSAWGPRPLGHGLNALSLPPVQQEPAHILFGPIAPIFAAHGGGHLLQKAL